jgi:hypothetical protein
MRELRALSVSAQRNRLLRRGPARPYGRLDRGPAVRVLIYHNAGGPAYADVDRSKQRVFVRSKPELGCTSRLDALCAASATPAHANHPRVRAMRVASDLRDTRARTVGSPQPKSTLIEAAMPDSAA